MRPIFLRVKKLAATFLHRPPSHQQGASLIFIIAAMLIMSALGAGIVKLTTTSTFTELTQDPYQKSRYLAESGFQYTSKAGINSGTFVLADGSKFEVTDQGNDRINVVATTNDGNLLISAKYQVFGDILQQVLPGTSYFSGNIRLTGSSQITGNIDTTSGVVSTSGTSVIYGDIYIGDGASVAPGTNYTGNIGISDSSFKQCVYSQSTSETACGCVYPDYCPNIMTTWQTENNILSMSSGKCFKNITMSSNWELNVEVGDEDRVIIVDILQPPNNPDDPNTGYPNGHLKIIPAPGTGGTGNLILYITSEMNLRSNSSINVGGSSNKIAVYYKGLDKLEIRDDVRFFGSLYAPNAELEIRGSSVFEGYMEAKSLLGDGDVRIYFRSPSFFKNYCMGEGVVIIVDNKGLQKTVGFNNVINTTAIDSNWLELIITSGVGDQYYPLFDFYAPKGITVESGVELYSTSTQGYIKLESDTGDILIEEGVKFLTISNANNETEEIYIKTCGNIDIRGVDLSARRYIYLEAGGNIYAQNADLSVSHNSSPNVDIYFKLNTQCSGVEHGKIYIDNLNIDFKNVTKNAVAAPSGVLQGILRQGSANISN